MRAKYRCNTPAAPAAPLTCSELLKQQISDEINERVDYLHQMRAIGGLDKGHERMIKAEVSHRAEELKRLEFL